MQNQVPPSVYQSVPSEAGAMPVGPQPMPPPPSGGLPPANQLDYAVTSNQNFNNPVPQMYQPMPPQQPLLWKTVGHVVSTV